MGSWIPHLYQCITIIVQAMLAQYQIKIFDQLIVYASINHVELNYMIMEHEALAMVYVLHKVLGLKLLWLFWKPSEKGFLVHMEIWSSKKDVKAKKHL